MGMARVREVVDASNALIVETNRHMIVSGRLGTSFLPVRLGVPLESCGSTSAASAKKNGAGNYPAPLRK